MKTMNEANIAINNRLATVLSNHIWSLTARVIWLNVICKINGTERELKYLTQTSIIYLHFRASLVQLLLVSFIRIGYFDEWYG